MVVTASWKDTRGKLRIGDDWKAISIIALSQSNPLKAVAEFVENSIDAGAKKVVITRGRRRGAHFLRVQDNGMGIRRDEEGVPDFQFVATHICDSIKRELKQAGAQGIQGEFGIGLLSFWTVGDELALSSSGVDGRLYEMRIRRGEPSYAVTRKRTTVALPGTDLLIEPLLPGLRSLTGERVQSYLAAELRDRIRSSGVEITVVDRISRGQFRVEPREFSGQRLHEVENTLAAESNIRLELYLSADDERGGIGLYRLGTRVLSSITELEPFNLHPWQSDYIQGVIDCPSLQISPGTRLGIVYDAAFENFIAALDPVKEALCGVIAAKRRAEDEEASKDMLRSVRRALREALLSLPPEDYHWFPLERTQQNKTGIGNTGANDGGVGAKSAELSPQFIEPEALEEPDESPQKALFEFAGPLFSVKVSPGSSVLPVSESRNLRALARDRSRRVIETGLVFSWEIVEGAGTFDNPTTELVTFHADTQPGLVRIRVSAQQGELRCEAEALITVVEMLMPRDRLPADRQFAEGIPSYTFEHASGELWHSRYEQSQNVVVINSGHRDFFYASRSKALKLRYICLLFSKELLLKNFVGISSPEALERFIELSLYTEENLK